MNVTIPMLLVSTVTTGFAPQVASQETNEPKVSSRRPVDVSVEGLGEASRRAPGMDTPLDCLESIADQATSGCLQASSVPTLGMLYPYPGLDNVFGPRAFVGGGADNQGLGDAATVSGGLANRAFEYVSTVGGGLYNHATAKAATIGGGLANLASGPDSFVGGGLQNEASGYGATVAGGIGNRARSPLATIGGGVSNRADGSFAMVLGGSANRAEGDYSFAAGRANVASGDFSLAAGSGTRTNHDGSFVWGDSFTATFPNPSLKTSSRADEFNVYASGGVRMFTNSAATTGVLLAPGGSTWTMVSDRDAKENIEPVDAQAVLDKVAELPLATWNYKAQDDSIRHMGPMAQDFHAAFGLGLGEKTIDTIDPNGVALAAIQGLNELVEEKDAEIEELRAANRSLRRSDEELRARVERLEALARAATAK